MALYMIKLEEAKLHISKGNSKIGKGIWSFSTLPGNSEHLIYIGGKDGENKILLTDIPGTCSKYCNGCAKDGACYAWRDAKLHHNVTIRAWGENTLLLRHDPDKLFSMIDEFITNKNKKKIQVNTWRCEIESLKQLELMNDLAAKHPEVAFGIYTKNYDVLEEFIKIHGVEALSENFTINVSEWHGVAAAFIAKYPGVFNVFEYDDSNHKGNELSEADVERLKHVTHCMAVKADGHHAKTPDGRPITCDMCKRCYHRTGQRTAVYAH